MNTTRALVLLPVLSTILTGCGPAPFESEPFGPQPLNAAESQRAGNVLGNAVEDAALEYRPMSSGAAIAGTSSCVTFEGDVTDADGDRIPADALLTFDCSETRLGFTGTVAGTAHVVDGAPNQVAWDYTSTVDMESSLTGPLGRSITRTRTGEIVASQGSVLGPFNLDRTLEVTTVFRKVNGNTRCTQRSRNHKERRGSPDETSHQSIWKGQEAPPVLGGAS